MRLYEVKFSSRSFEIKSIVEASNMESAARVGITRFCNEPLMPEELKKYLTRSRLTITRFYKTQR